MGSLPRCYQTENSVLAIKDWKIGKDFTTFFKGKNFQRGASAIPIVKWGYSYIYEVIAVLQLNQVIKYSVQYTL